MASGQSAVRPFESFTAIQQTTGATAATLRLLTAGLPGVYDLMIRYLAQDAALPVVPGKLGLSVLYHGAFTFDGTTYTALGLTALDTKTDGTFVTALTLAAVATGVNLVATSATAVVTINHLAEISLRGPVY